MAYTVDGRVELLGSTTIVEVADASRFLLMLNAVECGRIRFFTVGTVTFSADSVKAGDTIAHWTANDWELLKCAAVDALLDTYVQPHVDLELEGQDLTVCFLRHSEIRHP